MMKNATKTHEPGQYRSNETKSVSRYEYFAPNYINFHLHFDIAFAPNGHRRLKAMLMIMALTLTSMFMCTVAIEISLRFFFLLTLDAWKSGAERVSIGKFDGRKMIVEYLYVCG